MSTVKFEYVLSNQFKAENDDDNNVVKDGYEVFMNKSKPQYQLPVLNVPTYTVSRFTEDKDFNSWVKSFERYAMSLQDMTGALLALIEDRCLVKLEQRILNRRPNATYEEIKVILRKLYGKEYRYNDPLIEFASRRQQPNENIYNYLCELEHLAEAAYPDKNEPMLEPLKVDRFIRGIFDMKIKQELCRPPMCKNLSDVLSKAFELEEAFTKCETPKSIMNTSNRNSNYRVSFDENLHTIEKNSDQEFCTRYTHHKHLAKDCFRNPHHPRNRNNLETDVRSNICLKFNGDSDEPIQPQNITCSSVDEKDKSIEGMCLINEIPINFTIDTGAQITGLVSDCLLGIDLLEKFRYFSEPIEKLRETVKRLNQDLKLELKKYLRNAITNAPFVNTLSDTDFNHYLERINELIKSISASSLKELKPSPCFEHGIKLIDPNQTPIRQKMRRIPYSKRDEFKKMLDEMLDAKLIQPSESSWASPLMLRTQKDANPLPNSEDLYVLLSKSKCYTKTDLITGYFQILMKPENLKKKFVLETDASNTGIGAVLSQEKDGVLRPIAYFMLAAEHFNQYLYGQEFEIITDHQPLSWLRSCKNPNSRLARCLIIINNYTFTIVYSSGKTHTNADSVWRWDHQFENDTTEPEQEEDDLIVNFISDQIKVELSEQNSSSLLVTTEVQNKDYCIVWMKKMVKECGEKRPVMETSQMDTLFKRVLYENYDDFRLQSLLPTRPFQLVTIDIVGPLPLSKAVCDHFSKWVALFALQNTTADTVAKKLINLMMTHGLFVNILTDCTKNFQSELLSKIYELLDIYKLKTSPYHPECDGLTERFNRTLKTILSCFVNENQNDWNEYLQYLTYAYNTSTHATINHTPFEVVYGRKPKIPLDLVMENETETNEEIQSQNFSTTIV
ncbi:unnamed protein product [Brachionus calyciflorus]|uniref:Integrase catalytic domain-containing protein n=1 Tax=Brachionus calyciflorus TaxID=104777 RepID=A0A814KP09_9BILA|nr:unnamed protein product [Brachionus calyciflorus]